MLCAGLLTGCGEVNLTGACNVNPSGGYDYYFIIRNDVVTQPHETIVISGSGLNPASTTGSQNPLLGWEVQWGASALWFRNGEASPTMTWVVQTHPVSDPSAVTPNYLTASCV